MGFEHWRPSNQHDKSNELAQLVGTDGSVVDFVDGFNELQSLPVDLQDMFTMLSEDEFRADVTSSGIRALAAKQST